MAQFLRTLYIDVKMQTRVPVSLFFALVFPLLMLVLFTLSYKNPEIPGGYHFVDKYILIAVGLGTLPTCLISFAVWIGEAVNDGTYKRLALFNVSMKQVFSAALLSHMFLICSTIGLNLIVAALFFKAKLPDFPHLATYLVSIFYALLICMFVGLLVAFTAPNFKSVMPLSMAMMFALFIICGAFVPYDFLPDFLKALADYVPMKYMMQDFFALYSGKAYFNGKFLLLNTAWLIMLSIAAFILYRRKGRKILT